MVGDFNAVRFTQSAHKVEFTIRFYITEKEPALVLRLKGDGE